MKDNSKIKKEKRQRRAKRIRAKIFGTAQTPRLSVFRSNKHLYAQLIDDEKGNTVAAASDAELKNKKQARKEAAVEIGKLLAKKAADLKISEIIFDKGGYKYHGLIKSLAEGVREGGLKF